MKSDEIVICPFDEIENFTWENFLMARKGDLKYEETSDGVNFIKIIYAPDVRTKEELFDIVNAYFSYHYVKGNEVIQQSNKEGMYIIGKGVYSEFYEDTNSFIGVHYTFNAPHIIRVDVKEYLLRESRWMGGGYLGTSTKWVNVSEEGAFEALLNRVKNTMNKIQEAIKQGGNTGLESEDW